MHVKTGTWRGRKAWVLDNDRLSLTVTQGGGHLAALVNRDVPGVSPLWSPVWKTMEPWAYRPARDAARYESRLLASICGHNLCLPWFGGASESEAAAGMDGHGEASIVRWRLLSRRVSRAAVAMTCGCDLPGAQMRFSRAISTRRDSTILHVRERIRSTARRDLPFTLCQHVTVGPPFLEKGATVFDLSAATAHTFPSSFHGRQTLKFDAPFVWPEAPLAKGGTANQRILAKSCRASSDFTAQLMDPRRESAWFSAVHPGLGLLLAYVWRREDFPWTGIWTENYGRKAAPWAGRSLTRGLEFANTPFPNGLRKAVDMRSFHGLPTFRWLPALGAMEYEYDILLRSVPRGVRGVADIRAARGGLTVDLVL